MSARFFFAECDLEMFPVQIPQFLCIANDVNFPSDDYGGDNIQSNKVKQKSCRQLKLINILSVVTQSGKKEATQKCWDLGIAPDRCHPRM